MEDPNNAGRSTRVDFALRPHVYCPSSVNEQQIPANDKIEYLGLTLDKKAYLGTAHCFQTQRAQNPVQISLLAAPSTQQTINLQQATIICYSNPTHLGIRHPSMGLLCRLKPSCIATSTEHHSTKNDGGGGRTSSSTKRSKMTCRLTQS